MTITKIFKLANFITKENNENTHFIHEKQNQEIIFHTEENPIRVELIGIKELTREIVDAVNKKLKKSEDK